MNEQDILGKVIAYFPHGPYRKRRIQQFFLAAGTLLLNRCLATKGGTYTQTQTDGMDL